MTIYTAKGTHEFYTQTARHWCPKTEAFTGADSLLTAQRNGWRLVGLAYREEIIFGGSRHTTLFHFELHRRGDVVLMPVVANPFVSRLIRQLHIDIVPISQEMPDNTVDSLHELSA